ncbi:MAG: metal ABC transporter solute-binding protein, Zn/Mn family [Akkermansiaceae bacterium]
MLKKLLVVFVVLAAVAGGLFLLLQNEAAKVDDGSPDPDNAIRVVTTSTMVTDMVQAIGGERVSVKGLMGPGVDPHSFQVTPQATAALSKANIIFYSGLHLEGKIQDALEKNDKAHAVTSSIPKEKLLKPQEEFEGHFDPHVWGNPEVWVDCLDTIVKVLSKEDPEGAEEYEFKAELYYDSLMEMHEWAQKRVAEIPAEQRVLVTSHDAFFYFGKAYGFQVRGLRGVSTNSEPGLKDRAELVAFIKEKKLKMIFPESSVNAKGIKAVAEEAGVKVSEHELFSDAMGKLGDVVELHGESYDKGTYIGMMKHNINTIVDGLK